MKKFLLIPSLIACSAFAADPVAWLHLNGSEQFDGIPYRWLGSEEIRFTFEVPPATNLAVEFLWGAKNDQRDALLVIGSATNHLTAGGYRGFRWVRANLPSPLMGDHLAATLKTHSGDGVKPAFIAGTRLVAIDGPAMDETLPAAAAHRAHIEPVSGMSEASPDMRLLWDREPAAPAADERFRRAERNARQAAEAWYRSRRFIDGWLAHADPKTGLIPRNLRDSNYWNGRDAAADNYPYMVLTAAMTDRALLDGRLLDMLRTETKLTCRVDRLPDDYSFAKQGWRREKVDLDAIIFDGAEYVKDGLLMITEWLGPSPWSERMIGIVDDIWKNAAVETPFGNIPTKNFEVNGDLLQACSRLFWLTGDRKHLDWAIRLGDYYLLGDQHPSRDLADLALGDHSCEVINGLSELYVACDRAAPEKKKAYEKPLHELYDRILAVGRNEHGLLYLHINPKTGTHSSQLTDNWGYNYDGLYTAWLLDGTTAYCDAVRETLGNLKAHYTGQGGMCQSNTADGYADSIEGALTLINVEAVASANDWIDAEIRTMWSKQKPDGVIEGWHGDGNSARTSLMYALWKTQGCRVEPWRKDVRIGAVRDGNALYLSVAADEAWSGRIVFDRPRHREVMKLPIDYPRINKFPEWFTVKAETQYTVQRNGTSSTVALRDGLSVSLQAGGEMQIVVKATQE